MSNITAIIITKNEEQVIKDCLSNLKFVDKIIVVDSNSTDKTPEIAKNMGAEVVQHTFVDFSETRNFAAGLVKTDWILYVDSDERVTQDLQEKIQEAVKDKSYVAYLLTRKNYYLGKPWPYKEELIRLFLKEKLLGWKGAIHENPQIDGEVGKLKGELLHFTHRSLEEMLDKTIEWSAIEAKLLFENNHPSVTWWRLIRVFLTGFFNSYIVQKGYLVGTTGFIESYYQGFSMFVTYVKLWEMQQNTK